MAAGVAAARILTGDGMERINKLGDRLRDGINGIMEGVGMRWIRATGFGSAVGIRYTGPRPGILRDAFFFFLLKKRVYIGKRGFLSLNLMHGEGDMEFVLGVIREFVALVQGEVI